MTDTYLNAPYRDKDQVKAAGARWDPGRKQWYVPSGLDLTPFLPWLPRHVAEPEPRALGQPAGPVTTAVAASVAVPAAADAPTAVSPATATASVPVGVAGATTPAVSRKGVPLSELLSAVTRAVASAVASSVWTIVEVTTLRTKNGHVRLEVAERKPDGTAVAQADAVIWQSVAENILPEFEKITGAVLAPGIKLLVRARPRFHPVYGFSLDIDGIDPEYTLGELEAKKREIRARLQKEGLFARNRELAPPWDFNHVLVVSPQDAAGLGDFRAEARRLERNGVCRFHYEHARFQGPGAPAEIIAALRAGLAATTIVDGLPLDAVVIIRGGGATNDLAWLNDYELARFVCLLDVPVFTGIGHERDSTILDEVANTAFDTPSKVVAGIVTVVAARVAEAKDAFLAIRSHGAVQLGATRTAVEKHLAAVSADAARQITLAHREAGEFLTQVRTASERDLRRASVATHGSVNAVGHLATQRMRDVRQTATAWMVEVRAEGRRSIRVARVEAAAATETVFARGRTLAIRTREIAEGSIAVVANSARRMVRDATGRSEGLLREIVGQGPDRTLRRGFAIVRDAQRRTVTSAGQLDASTEIGIEFRDGEIAARVTHE